MFPNVLELSTSESTRGSALVARLELCGPIVAEDGPVSCVSSNLPVKVSWVGRPEVFLEAKLSACVAAARWLPSPVTDVFPVFPGVNPDVGPELDCRSEAPVAWSEVLGVSSCLIPELRISTLVSNEKTAHNVQDALDFLHDCSLGVNWGSKVFVRSISSSRLRIRG